MDPTEAFGYGLVMLAAVVLILVVLLLRLLTRAERAEDRAARSDRTLAVVRERVENARPAPWRRPPAERFDEHTNRALRINDPDATQLNYRDMT